MARTMTDEQERDERYHANKVGGCVGCRGAWAELDAERAAHEVTKREWSARLGRAHDISSHEITALKARLALAEAALVAWMDSDHRRDKLTAAWRAAK